MSVPYQFDLHLLRYMMDCKPGYKQDFNKSDRGGAFAVYVRKVKGKTVEKNIRTTYKLDFVHNELTVRMDYGSLKNPGSEIITIDCSHQDKIRKFLTEDLHLNYHNFDHQYLDNAIRSDYSGRNGYDCDDFPILYEWGAKYGPYTLKTTVIMASSLQHALKLLGPNLQSYSRTFPNIYIGEYINQFYIGE